MLKPMIKFVAVATLSALAVAQTKAPATSTPSTKPATSAPAKTAPATAKPTTTAPAKTAPASNKPAALQAKTAAKTEAKPAPPKPSAKAEEPKAEAKIPMKSAKTAGRRDPFVSPVKLAEDQRSKTAACNTGARCLVIDQVVLKGVVKTQQGMIAMVENSAKKQYNLREKDPVLNGAVYKITQDSIIFRENVVDNLGRSTTKEVVKRVTVPVV
jgi:Tfp pilus assembly protein PilP